MFSVLRVLMIVLVVILGIGAAMWRTSRWVERPEPVDPDPHIQQWNESLRELDQAVEKSEAAREQSKTVVEPLEAPAASPTQSER